MALMLSKEAQQALISWEPISSRIITARFQTTHKRINLQIIQCYAPTNNAEEEMKDNFYNQLQHLLQSRKEKDLTLLMGDMNAKVGNNNNGYELAMGRHGLGTMNENGERFSDICADTNLVIGGTIFPHKHIHKATWISPDHTTENQIDHICINRKFRRSLLDVTVKRGADAGSDHHPLAAKLQLKLKCRNTPAGNRTKYNIQLFQDIGTTELYKTTLQNRFQTLQEQPVKEYSLKSVWKETCLEDLGKRTTNHKPWLSTETWKKIEERRAKKDTPNKCKTRARKAAAHNDYEEANKEVRKSAKRNKKIYIEALAKEAQEAAAQNNLKELYMTTRKLAEKFRQNNTQIRNKEG
nr:craniofacial development protein 2 [Syngnathus scovelli]